MTIRLRFRLIAIAGTTFLYALGSQGATIESWDGIWIGSLGHFSSLTVRVANDQVISYTIQGTSVVVRYTKTTPTTLSFGDRDHFSVKLTRTGASSASAEVYGRNGIGSGVFTKQ